MELKTDTGMLCPATHETGHACPGCEKCASPELVQAQADDMTRRFGKLKDLVAVQCSAGNWDANEYMRGMANGLLVAQACFDDAEPAFKEAPVQAHPAASDGLTLADLIGNFPELNLSNYNDDDVGELNVWGIEVCQAYERALAATQPAVAPADGEMLDQLNELQKKYDEQGTAFWATSLKLQIAEQALAARKPAAPWMRVEGDCLYISRSNWIYPQATEDDAGPRDRARYKAIGRRDGDMVLHFNGAWLDAYDLAVMLTYDAAAPSVPVQAGVPEGWKYRVLVNKHTTGPVRDGEFHFKGVFGSSSGWMLSLEQPNDPYLLEAIPLAAASPSAPAAPVQWDETAALTVMGMVGDGPHGEADVQDALEFLRAAESVRSNLAAQVQPVAVQEGAVMEMELALYRDAYGTQAPSEAVVDVLNERRRQVEGEGWSAEHDDNYRDCELARAAATYALCTAPEQIKVCDAPVWPWPMHWWKPTSYRRNIVKATALLLAEIERLDRVAPSQSTQPVDGKDCA